LSIAAILNFLRRQCQGNALDARSDIYSFGWFIALIEVSHTQSDVRKSQLVSEPVFITAGNLAHLEKAFVGANEPQLIAHSPRTSANNRKRLGVTNQKNALQIACASCASEPLDSEAPEIIGRPEGATQSGR